MTCSVFILPEGVPGPQDGHHVPEALLWKARVDEVRVPFGPRQSGPALLKVRWFYSKEDVERRLVGAERSLL